jgi:hypothetical protein
MSRDYAGNDTSGRHEAVRPTDDSPETLDRSITNPPVGRPDRSVKVTLDTRVANATKQDDDTWLQYSSHDTKTTRRTIR